MSFRETFSINTQEKGTGRCTKKTPQIPGLCFKNKTCEIIYHTEMNVLLIILEIQYI